MSGRGESRASNWLTECATSFIILGMSAKRAIPDKEDFSVSELVELFGIAERTIQYWLSDKRAEYFPNAYRQGLEANSAWRIPRKDVVAFDKRRRGLT